MTMALFPAFGKSANDTELKSETAATWYPSIHGSTFAEPQHCFIVLVEAHAAHMVEASGLIPI